MPEATGRLPTMRDVVPFTVSADIDLSSAIRPYLIASEGDVDIRRGDVPPDLPGSGVDGAAYRIRDGRVLILAPRGLRFLIEEGRRIIYSGSERDAQAIALFLFGSAWPALCCQRGWIPILASAVEVGGRIHAFGGAPAEGKSTVACALTGNGIGLFTDDLLLLATDGPGEVPWCLSGARRVKLWPDALPLARSRAISPVRSDDPLHKVYAEASAYSDATTGPLASFTLLAPTRPDQTPAIDRLRGLRAISALGQMVYWPTFAAGILGKGRLNRGLAAFAAGVPVRQFRRRIDRTRFDDDLHLLRDAIRGRVED